MFAPSAPMNSVARRTLSSRPLTYMMPEASMTCTESRIGKSASGIGCAPMAALIAAADLMSTCASRCWTERTPESLAISSRAFSGNSSRIACPKGSTASREPGAPAAS